LLVLPRPGSNLRPAFPGCQPRQHPGVARAAGHPTPIGPFEQRDEVLAREPETVPQRRRGGRAELDERGLEGGAELGEGTRRRITLGVGRLRGAVAGEVRQECANGDAGKLALELGDGGYLPASIGEAPRDLLAG